MGTKSSLPRLLTVPEVAEATGLPAWRIYELVGAGKIPHLRVGRTLQFSEAALARWIEDEHARSGEGGWGASPLRPGGVSWGPGEGEGLFPRL